MTAVRGIAGGTIYQRGARTKSRYYHYYHLISQCIIVLYAFCVRFSPVRGVNLIPDAVCKSRSYRQILSRLRADLRENPTKHWVSRDALIQSAGSISNSARYHSYANIALGPILKMYIPGQIRIFNALNSDSYSTGNAPPSGNNGQLCVSLMFSLICVWINGWVNKREAGDLRRYRTHYDVTVMWCRCSGCCSAPCVHCRCVIAVTLPHR